MDYILSSAGEILPQPRCLGSFCRPASLRCSRSLLGSTLKVMQVHRNNRYCNRVYLEGYTCNSKVPASAIGFRFPVPFSAPALGCPASCLQLDFASYHRLESVAFMQGPCMGLVQFRMHQGTKPRAESQWVSGPGEKQLGQADLSFC